MMPVTSPFLPSLLHQQFLARGLAPATSPAAPQHSDPATPPSSEDNMSPPPRIDTAQFARQLADEESIADKQVGSGDLKYEHLTIYCLLAWRSLTVYCAGHL